MNKKVAFISVFTFILFLVFICLPHKVMGQKDIDSNTYDFIMPNDLFNALGKDAQQKVLFLTNKMKQGRDPLFEDISKIFPNYMNYPKTLVGVKEHKDKILLSWDGAIVFPPMYISFEINDTPFGRENEKNISRCLLDSSYLPIVVTKYKYDGLQYEQTIFGYSKDFSFDNPLIAYVRMKVINPSDQPVKTKLTLWFRGTGVHRAGYWWAADCGRQIVHCPRKLSLERNKILDENGDFIFISDISPNTFKDDKLSFELTLKPNEEKTLDFRIPRRIIRPDEFNLLDISFEEALGKVKTYWKELVESGMQIEVPENIVNNAYKTWHINNFLLTQQYKLRYPDYRIVDAPFFYEAVFGYASAMYLNTITTGGYYKEAKKTAGMFQSLQRPNGAFSGEHNYIVPHQHGAILYTICQVYRKGRDAEWFETMVPDIIKACDWIIRERGKSMKMENGRKTVLYGMLPEYRYNEDLLGGQTYTHDYLGNVWCWAGLNEAAIALEEIGGVYGNESIRLKKEASKYKEDLFASMGKAIIKHNDVIFLPIVITNKKPFENLQESRLAHYYNILAPRMLESEFFDIDDERIHWVPDFIEKRKGLILGLARFGQSPWLIDPHFIAGYGITNLRLNRIDKFLLTYYGLISYGMARDVYSTQEVSDILNGTNQNWDTLRQPHLHSTSQLIRLTNMMLVKEENDELWLAWGVPRRWLEDGKDIKVKKAQTCFGPVDYNIESHVSKGYIKTEFSLSVKKQPSAIRLKLRHPDQRKIKKVEVNGKNWVDFEEEVINLYSFGGDLSVVTYY
ncbi:MAG: hypothetical protein ACOX19_12585 [Fermentimonas sp.]|jgi:hypothetical protein